MWACTNCHKRLSRKLTICPKCGGKANYICAECFKDLPNGKHNYCGFHQQQKREERKEALKKAGGAVGAAVGVVSTVMLTPLKNAVENPEKIKNLVNLIHK